MNSRIDRPPIHHQRYPFMPRTSPTTPAVWDWRTWILRHGPNSSTTRHVLLTLSCFMNSAGQSCFPSIDSLAEATQLSRRSVITHLQKAASDGWITVSKHGFGDQRWKRNEYHASIPEKVVKEVHQEQEKAVNGVHHDDQKGGEPPSEGGEPLSGGGERGSPYLSNTSSKNSPNERGAESSTSPDGAPDGEHHEDDISEDDFFWLDESQQTYLSTMVEKARIYSSKSLPELVRNQWGGYRQGQLPLADLRRLWKELTATFDDHEAHLRLVAAIVITGNAAKRPCLSYMERVLEGFTQQHRRKRRREEKRRREADVHPEQGIPHGWEPIDEGSVREMIEMDLATKSDFVRRRDWNGVIQITCKRTLRQAYDRTRRERRETDTAQEEHLA